jgi:hypothetical protein
VYCKRFHTVWLIVSASLAFTACLGPEGIDENEETPFSTVITTTLATETETETSISETVQFEPVPVPEGGWTGEELARTIRLNGVLIELPFTVESLGEQYRLQEDGEGMSWNESDQRLATTLIYEDTHVAGVIIHGFEGLNFDIARTLEVESLFTIFGFEGEEIALHDEEAATFFTINGVSRSTTRERIYAALGEPYEVEPTRLRYKDRDTGDIILVIGLDTLSYDDDVSFYLQSVFIDLSN